MLRCRLKNLKFNGIRDVVLSHLYELLPETEDQIKIFPSVLIDIPEIK